jgi:hypothetical protein
MFILDVPLQTAQIATVAYLEPDQLSGGQLNAPPHWVRPPVRST